MKATNEATTTQSQTLKDVVHEQSHSIEDVVALLSGASGLLTEMPDSDYRWQVERLVRMAGERLRVVGDAFQPHI